MADSYLKVKLAERQPAIQMPICLLVINSFLYFPSAESAIYTDNTMMSALLSRSDATRRESNPLSLDYEAWALPLRCNRFFILCKEPQQATDSYQTWSQSLVSVWPIRLNHFRGSQSESFDGK